MSTPEERKVTALYATVMIVFVVVGFVQGVVGTISNVISLSYFLNKERETLASKLTIMLNITDLLVCFSNIVAMVAFVNAYFTTQALGSIQYLVFWLELLVAATAFATCLLSVTRTISLVYPFYIIKKKAIAICIVFYWITLMVSKFLLPILNLKYIHEVYNITELSLIVFIVIVCLVICILKLRINDKNPAITNSARRYATITILVISGVFCVVNIAVIIGLTSGSWVEVPKKGEPMDKDAQNKFLLIAWITFYAVFVGIPFNSAINPIIYFIRKKQIRDYVKTTFIGRCCYHHFYCCCVACCGEGETRQENRATFRTTFRTTLATVQVFRNTQSFKSEISVPRQLTPRLTPRLTPQLTRLTPQLTPRVITLKSIVAKSRAQYDN